MFGFFRRAKKEPSFDRLVAEHILFEKVKGQLAKAVSLRKLGRDNEAKEIFLAIRVVVMDYIRANPTDKRGFMTMALIRMESGLNSEAEDLLKKILTSPQIVLDEHERLVIESTIQSLARQKPIDERAKDAPSSYTQIYACLNCGRLCNFVTIPCPCCRWSARNAKELSAAIVLGLPSFSVQQLAIIAREVNGGRSAWEIIPNLESQAASYLQQNEASVSKLFSLLEQNRSKNERNLELLRECSDCGRRLFVSSSEECDDCGARVTWSRMVRMIICIDNLLWVIENRLELPSTPEFSDFVCLLVFLRNKLLFKQEMPSTSEASYLRQLLVKLKSLSDLGGGAVVTTSDAENITMYLVKDRAQPDSQSFGMLLAVELRGISESWQNA